MSLKLPEELDFGEIDFPVTVAELYKIFENDFIVTNTMFLGKKVVFDNTYKNSPYPEGFWHLITRVDHKTDERLPDFRRSERLPWIKPIIEQFREPEIKFWHNIEPSRRGADDKYYLWYEKGNFLVILKARKKNYFLATSFYVDGYNVKKFERKYKAGKSI